MPFESKVLYLSKTNWSKSYKAIYQKLARKISKHCLLLCNGQKSRWIRWWYFFGTLFPNCRIQKQMTFFLNLGAKWSRCTSFWKKILIFETWHNLTCHWPFLRPNLKINVTIEFFIPNVPKTCQTTLVSFGATFSFGDLMRPDLDLDPYQV